jgi:alanyl aminopeptidase
MQAARYLALCALLLTSGHGLAQEGRLGTDIVPIHQSVRLQIDPSGHEYSGTTAITLKASTKVSAFRLHSDGIEIERVRLGFKGQPLALNHSIQNDLLVITPAQAIEPGRYSLVIDFGNEFNTQAVGLYRAEAEGLGYAYTQFQASDARKAFPCFDEPEFKIPFQLTITAREGDAVVTNTPLRAESRDNGWKTLEFETSPPLPSYLIAMAVGPMDSVEIPDLPVPGRIYTPRGQSGLAAYAAEMVTPILQAQQAYFGMAYPYRKLDFIAIPEYWPGAMEHPGAITYSDEIILLDPQNVSARQKRFAARVIAHELAHMWFGNLVTLEWWDDLWLNESFADWFGDKTTVELYPESGHGLVELRSVNDVMQTDSRPTAEPIRQPVVNPGDLLSNVGLAYNKGKSVIAMFERWIGPENFRKGVNAYLRKHAWGNTQAADFWASLATGAGADVAASM